VPLRQRTLSLIVLAGALLLIAGCAEKRVVLVPAPNAPIENNAVVGQNAGVTMLVQPNAWQGPPADLPDYVTPLKVTIRNNSGHPLRIAYDQFVLVGPDNRRYAALPPTDIRAGYGEARQPDSPRVVLAMYAAPQTKKTPPPPPPPRPPTQSQPRTPANVQPRRPVVVVPEFVWGGYYVAPYWGFAYPGIDVWPYPWPPNYFYHDQYWRYVRRTRRATESMLRKAIPEGVVETGGHVSGFLYFQKVKAGKNPEPLTFKAKLVDARAEQSFGEINIPLVAKQVRE
jgi:hypothetical protein